MKFNVTYNVWGSNREKPLYTNTRTIKADTAEEAAGWCRKFLSRDVVSVEPIGTVTEGLENSDLKRLVTPTINIDEFKSKMGSDSDVCVLAFTVVGKDPALDLVNFVEKSYEFVLDADSSSGEDFNGNYMVFVELERTKKLPEQIIEMIEDIVNLTDHNVSDWKFTYYKSGKTYDLTTENLQSVLVLTPQEYEARYKPDEEIQEAAELNAYAALANAPVKQRIQQTTHMDNIQILAGIK